MAHTDWEIRGPQYGSCNCASGCPCQFNALPTYGDCQALVGMRIDAGYFGDVGLDGTIWVSVLKWPGAIHEGGGERQSIIDERASEAQREALLSILNGEHSEPGATIFNLFTSVIDTVHPPLFKPIEFECDIERRRGKIVIPGVVESHGAPIKNPVTGEEHRARVTLPDGFEFTEAEFATGSTKATGAVTMAFEDRFGLFSMIHTRPTGPVRP